MASIAPSPTSLAALALSCIAPSPTSLAALALSCIAPSASPSDRSFHTLASRCRRAHVAGLSSSTSHTRSPLRPLNSHADGHANLHAITNVAFTAESHHPSASPSTDADTVPSQPGPLAAPVLLGFGDFFRWFSSRMIRGVLIAAPLIFAAHFGNAVASAAAAEHSIGSSSLGVKVASFLRRSGLNDEAIVVAIASLPALELRGAIPVGYWMKLPPQKTYALAVLGNMLPVPFIALYLERFFNYVARSSEGGKRLVDRIITNTRRKAEPIDEFKWIGLMLFVAVPFPGTGAWTGAFAASILAMTFWESMSANFVGVLLAGVLVNLVVSVGIREAIFVGIALFLLSMFMWRILRFFNQRKASDA